MRAVRSGTATITPCWDAARQAHAEARIAQWVCPAAGSRRTASTYSRPYHGSGYETGATGDPG